MRIITEITIPAMECRTLSKKTKKYTTRLFIGGYVSNPYKGYSEVLNRYKQWKEHCWLHLRAALVTGGWDGVINPSEGYKLTTEAFFRTKVHPDTLNVHKSLEDIRVFRRGKSSKGTFYFEDDKYLAGEFKAPQYDKNNPRLEVKIECSR